MFESIGPVWDGNEVWLIIAGGATFAAFPSWYASMFSGLLPRLAARPLLPDHPRGVVRVAVEEHEPAVARGLDVGECDRQLRRRARLGDRALRPALRHPARLERRLHGTFWDLFNGYTVFAGLTVVVFFMFHGAVFLTLRTTGDLCRRAITAARMLALPAAALAAAFAILTVVVAVDRNDKSVFPPVLPALFAHRAPHCSPSPSCFRAAWAARS